jgi:bacterioferritin-associated ferredoxin
VKSQCGSCERTAKFGAEENVAELRELLRERREKLRGRKIRERREKLRGGK